MKRQRSIWMACAAAALTMLAVAPAQGQGTVMCPVDPWLVVNPFGPSPDQGFCGPDVQLTWPEGYCGCSPSKLFSVSCTAGYGGLYVDGVPACAGGCHATRTDTSCIGDLERTGCTTCGQKGTGPSAAEAQPVAGHPVSMTTGEMYFTHTDAVVGEIAISRTYNSNRLSAANRYGTFGAGWNASFEPRLRFATAAVIEARLGDGLPVFYLDPEADSRFDQELPFGKHSWIVEVSGLYLRRFRGGTYETYDAAGRIQSATDASGVQTTYARDGSNRVTGITRLGRTLGIVYDEASGKPSRLEGPGGAILATYTYDGSGRVETVSYPDGSGYRYGYDGYGRVLWVKDAQGNPLEAHAYDAQGRAITSEVGDGQDKLSFSYGANQTTVTDALGNATVYEWADVRKMYRITKVTGPCLSCGGGGGDTQEWTYNEDGDILSYKDGAGKVWTYTYTADHDLATETDPLSRVTTYTYDAEGRVASVSRPGGGSTSTTWGDAGPLTITEAVTVSENRTTAIGYGGFGKPTTITDPRGKTTTLAYDAVTGDLLSVTDPLSHQTSFAYDDRGRRTSVTDALNHTTSTLYDARGRVTRITNHDGTYTSFTYDKGGRRTAVTDPLQRTTSYGYDRHGRLVAVVDPLNGVTKYGYDEMGNLTSLTDAKNQKTSFTYDNHRRVSVVTYPGGAAESFTYDLAGRLATKTDRKAVVTTYSYDNLGRLTGKTYSDGTTPPVSYTYDTAGRLATAANGTDTLTWSYDLAGQLLSEQSAKNATTVAYTYDAAGSRLSVSLDGEVFVTYAYDDASRLTTITRGANVFGFGYDNANRRTSMSYPNGVDTSYTYDNLNRLLRLKADHGATPITDFQYTYDAAGNRLSKTQLDYAEQYSYDNLYRLTGVERTTGPNSGIQRFGYDAVGNRQTHQINESVLSATFNEKNQLLSTTAGGQMLWRGSLDEPGNVSFTSALVNGQPARMLAGNVFEAMLPMQSGSNTVTLEAKDTSGNTTTKNYSLTVSGAGATYTYDANGNLTQKVEGGDTWVYTWNAENQLTKVEKNAVEVARFKYDPLGRRLEKAAGGVTTLWTYDREDIHRETAGAITPRYVHGPGIDEPLAADTGSGLSYYHADGLGSIGKTTLAGGVVSLTRRYDAWGVLEDGAGVSGSAFTAREWDSTVQMHFYRARWYDQGQGRFVSEDPVGFGAGVNFYTYTLGNPVRYEDPFGLDVTVCFYADAAFGAGHVGYGLPGESGTQGFYSKSGVPFGEGAIKPDKQKEGTCKVLPAKPWQDDCMRSCRERRAKTPGKYDLLTRQCTGFVRECLLECALPPGDLYLIPPEPYFDTLPPLPTPPPKGK